MRSGPNSGPGEDPRDVIAYLGAAGHPLSLEQFERLHRRRIVAAPRADGSYPPGTAERVLRIAQLRTHVRQFDELAWRLWWEGHAVDALLVRAFVERRAQRWDEVVRADDVDEAERDVLEDVFFRHLKKGPSASGARRALERGAATYVAFSQLAAELSLAGSTGAPAESALAAGPLAGLVGAGDVEFMKAASEVSDEDLERARRVAQRIFRLLGLVGATIHRASGAGRRDSAGRSLLAMTESPSEQVLAVLLAAEAVRAAPGAAGGPEGPDPRPPAVGFDEYWRLARRAPTVPGLEALLAPGALAAALSDDGALVEWRRAVAALVGEDAAAEAVGAGADDAEDAEGDADGDADGVVTDGAPPPEDGDGDGDERVESKKKIPNDPRR